MTKQKLTEAEQPFADQLEMFRMSENGHGFIQWGHQTHHDWDTVMEPGYFRVAKIRTGLQTYDRIDVTTNAFTGNSRFGTLVVTGVGLDGRVAVKVLVGPISAEIETDNPFDILGLDKTAALSEVEMAFRKLSKRMHPDTGGDSAAFDRLVWAREECRKICAKHAA